MIWGIFGIRLGVVFVALAMPAVAQEFVRVWDLGTEDGATLPFTQESGVNAAPGSATAKDDDYYLAGSYPAPIGNLAVDEPLGNFERALTSWDKINRVHFPLTAAQAGAGARHRLSFKMIHGGDTSGGFGTHDIAVRWNGVEIAQKKGIVREEMIVATLPAGAAVAGANVITIERTDGSANAWVQFDFLRLECDPAGLADADQDGMPLHFETAWDFSDVVAEDAEADPDGDGLSNLEEFQKGTSPCDADSDNDGVSDGAELAADPATDPLVKDTDGDGLSDGEETTSNPTLVDTDGDGFSDNIEIERGTDPAAAASKPFRLSEVIGMQFVAERDPAAALKSHELAGIFRSGNWNASLPLPVWQETTTALTGNATDLRDAAGVATTVDAAWSYRWANDGSHLGNSDEKLLDGMISAARWTVSSAGQPVTGTTQVELALTEIPYQKYDLIVYLGDRAPGGRGWVQLDDDEGTRRYFSADSAPPFVKWREAVSADADRFPEANFVRFRGLSGAARKVSLGVQAMADGSWRNVSIHGFQLVNQSSDVDGDGLSDAAEIENGTDPQVSDGAADPDGDGVSTAAEIAAGTSPQLRDTDGDGLPDGAETGANGNPLVVDSDGDGLTDGDEVNFRPFPSLPDDADSDDDSFGDLAERLAGSDPKNAASLPAPLPKWDATARTWTWNSGPLRVRWNHDRTMLGAISGEEAMLCEALVGRKNLSWESHIGIGLRFHNGRLTWRFRTGKLTFKTTGGDAYYAAQWRTYPQLSDDLTAKLGFSGFGTNDLSDPLRFEFKATKGDAGAWTAVCRILNVAKPEGDAARTVISHTVSLVEADSALAAGTAEWNGGDNESPFTTFNTEPGVDVFLSEMVTGPADVDRDGLPDAWETANGLDPAVKGDALADADGDGVVNRDEWRAGTNPQAADSDGDGADDLLEIRHGSDALSAASRPVGLAVNGPVGDLDGDGLSDAWLAWSGGKSRAANGDDDGDGATNFQESVAGTDPDDPRSKLSLLATKAGADLWLEWNAAPWKSHRLENSTDLTSWVAAGAAIPVPTGNLRQLKISDAFQVTRNFYRVQVSPLDSDQDGVEDWTEVNVLGSSPADANSLGQPITNGAGQMVSGDALALYQQFHGISDSGAASGNPVAPTPVQASRFLMQATFGPTLGEIEAVRRSGFEAWIAAQVAAPPSWSQPYIDRIQEDAQGPHHDKSYAFNQLAKYAHGMNVTTPFARNAVGGQDQLRQRVAFALSQILVVSRRDAMLEEKPAGLANYYDMLVRNALGNYGTLLREVAMHPAMGWYLSHAGNQKGDPSIPRYPDENFAREIMQLFSIGLWELNPDGTQKLQNGEPVPTYDNGDITEMARVFTGLYFDAPWGFDGGGWSDAEMTKPMRMFHRYHDFGRKKFLGGTILPAREPSMENGLRDVEDAVDSLFRHPNTPPFVSRQLIQFLVTDNPTPAYVKRVQDVFVDDGGGVRGNLAAVVKAILLDPEARSVPTSPEFGKVREPVIRTMHLGRLFGLAENHPDFTWWNWTDTYYGQSFQEPLNSPSVFNFYTPVYQAPGEIREAGLVSPGFQLVNTFSAVSFPNLLLDYLHGGFRSSYLRYPLDFRRGQLLADSPEALVDQANLLLCAGNMTARTRTIILGKIRNAALTPDERVALALWLAMACPEGAIQR